jgi:hypothetical protein
MPAKQPFTVGDLRRMLNGCDDADELEVAGGLTIYRIKQVGDDVQFMEFNEFLADGLEPFQRIVNKGVTVAAVFLADD